MTTKNLAQKTLALRDNQHFLIQAVRDGTKHSALISRKYEKEVQESGLLYLKNPVTQEFVITKSKENIDKWTDFFNRSMEMHKELGLKLGFPVTAVDAFIGKIKRKEIRDIPNEYLGFFAFSEDHFEEEKKVVDKWIESAMKKYEEEII